MQLMTIQKWGRQQVILEFQNNTQSLNFQEHETRTDFEFRDINDVKKIFSATQQFEFFEYF